MRRGQLASWADTVKWVVQLESAVGWRDGVENIYWKQKIGFSYKYINKMC